MEEKGSPIQHYLKRISPLIPTILLICASVAVVVWVLMRYTIYHAAGESGKGAGWLAIREGALWFSLLVMAIAVFFLQRAVTLRRELAVRKREEDSLTRVNRALKALNQCGQAVVRAKDQATLLDQVCGVIAEACGYRLAWIGFAQDDEKKSIRPVAYAGYEHGYLETLQLTWADDERGRGPAGTAVRTGQPCIIRHVHSDERFLSVRDEARKRGYASVVGLPLIADGKPFGVLCIYGLEPDAFDAEEVEPLVGLASDLARGIKALQMREEKEMAQADVAQRTALLGAINHVLHETLTCESDKEVARVSLAVAVELTGSKFGFIGEINRRGRFDIIALSSSGWEACRIAKSDAAAMIENMTIRGFWGQALLDGSTQVVNDVANHPDHVAVPKGHPPLTCFLGVPLKRGGKTRGMVALANKEGGYTRADKEAIEALAGVFVEALVRKRAEEQIKGQLGQLAALRRIDLAITGSLDVRVTLNRILDEIMAQLKVDAAGVLLLNPHMQMLEYTAGRGFRTGEIEKTRMRVGEGHAGKVARERRTIAFPELAEATVSVRTELVKSEGFAAYFGVPLLAKGQLKGVLEVFHRSPLHVEQGWIDFVETLAGEAAIAIDGTQMFETMQRSYSDLTLAYETTLEGWARALDLRSRETERHTERVTDLTVHLAHVLNVDEAQIAHYRRGAILHDIGKIGVPDSILLKPGPLTDEEWKIMRRHAEYAYEMLSPIAYLRPALDIPYCHHEKWDGKGYPRRLKGEQIPLAARIFAIIDVWDALTSDRVYRPAWSKERALEYVRANTETHFDPKVVPYFLKMIESEHKSGSGSAERPPVGPS